MADEKGGVGEQVVPGGSHRNGSLQGGIALKVPDQPLRAVREAAFLGVGNEVAQVLGGAAACHRVPHYAHAHVPLRQTRLTRSLYSHMQISVLHSFNPLYNTKAARSVC